MAIRNMLHISKLKAFEAFLESKGYMIIPTVGAYEVLRAQKPKKERSIISMVYEVKPIFFRGRVREALWRKLRDQYLNVEAEIEIER